MDRQNLTLLTDLYELTMMQGYFKHKDRNETVIFDAFFRNNPMDSGYSIMAGLEQVIQYIKELKFEQQDIDYLASLCIFQQDFLDYLKDFKFTGDIYAIPEGSIMFPREPMIKVIAPIMQAQLVETAILNIINQDVPRLLRSQRRRNHGIRASPCTGSGCRYLRCKSCHDRWLCRYFQRTGRTAF